MKKKIVKEEVVKEQQEIVKVETATPYILNKTNKSRTLTHISK